MAVVAERFGGQNDKLVDRPREIWKNQTLSNAQQRSHQKPAPHGESENGDCAPV
jgi:hypothetical protein